MGSAEQEVLGAQYPGIGPHTPTAALPVSVNRAQSTPPSSRPTSWPFLPTRSSALCARGVSAVSHSDEAELWNALTLLLRERSNSGLFGRKSALWGNKGRISLLYVQNTKPWFCTYEFKLQATRDFSGGPVVRTLCFHCRGHRFDPWSQN